MDTTLDKFNINFHHVNPNSLLNREYKHIFNEQLKKFVAEHFPNQSSLDVFISVSQKRYGNTLPQNEEDLIEIIHSDFHAQIRKGYENLSSFGIKIEPTNTDGNVNTTLHFDFHLYFCAIFGFKNEIAYSDIPKAHYLFLLKNYLFGFNIKENIKFVDSLESLSDEENQAVFDAVISRMAEKGFHGSFLDLYQNHDFSFEILESCFILAARNAHQSIMYILIENHDMYEAMLKSLGVVISNKDTKTLDYILEQMDTDDLSPSEKTQLLQHAIISQNKHIVEMIHDSIKYLPKEDMGKNIKLALDTKNQAVLQFLLYHRFNDIESKEDKLNLFYYSMDLGLETVTIFIFKELEDCGMLNAKIIANTMQHLDKSDLPVLLEFICINENWDLNKKREQLKKYIDLDHEKSVMFLLRDIEKHLSNDEKIKILFTLIQKQKTKTLNAFTLNHTSFLTLNQKEEAINLVIQYKNQDNIKTIFSSFFHLMSPAFKEQILRKVLASAKNERDMGIFELLIQGLNKKDYWMIPSLFMYAAQNPIRETSDLKNLFNKTSCVYLSLDVILKHQKEALTQDDRKKVCILAFKNKLLSNLEVFKNFIEQFEIEHFSPDEYYEMFKNGILHNPCREVILKYFSDVFKNWKMSEQQQGEIILSLLSYFEPKLIEGNRQFQQELLDKIHKSLIENYCQNIPNIYKEKILLQSLRALRNGSNYVKFLASELFTSYIKICSKDICIEAFMIIISLKENSEVIQNIEFSLKQKINTFELTNDEYGKLVYYGVVNNKFDMIEPFYDKIEIEAKKEAFKGAIKAGLTTLFLRVYPEGLIEKDLKEYLSVALEYHRQESIDFFIGKFRDQARIKLFYIAIEKNNVKTLEFLFKDKRTFMNTKVEKGFALALQCNRIEVIKFLLKECLIPTKLLKQSTQNEEIQALLDLAIRNRADLEEDFGEDNESVLKAPTQKVLCLSDSLNQGKNKRTERAFETDLPVQDSKRMKK